MKNTNENGRGMVEMLGVLAVIGVLSILGIATYLMAMDKHRADTILEEARRRATIITGQMGLADPNNLMKGFADHNDFGYAVFDDKVYGEDGTAPWAPSDRRFSIKVEGVSKKVCQRLQKTKSGIIQKFSPSECEDNVTVILTYNNDLSTMGLDSDYTTEEECSKTPYKWCSALNSCKGSGCCSGKSNQCCNADTGDTASFEGEVCDFNGGEDNGMCMEGKCVENLSGKPCNINRYSGNTDCGGVNSGFYCYGYNSAATCSAISPEQRATGKLQTDPRAGRGTDWYSAMNFCNAIGKKLPSMGDVAITIPSGKTQCHLSDCPDGGALEPALCVTSSTTPLQDLRTRFSDSTHAVWVSNTSSSRQDSSYVLDLGANYAGYVYQNHKTSPLGLAVCE